MSKFQRSKDIASLAQEDNQIALEIYNCLASSLIKEGKKRPVFETILGIYFIDLLKFFTGVGYRQREASLTGVQVDKEISQISRQWPYILMREIDHGFDLSQFEWGHKFEKPRRYLIKKILSKLMVVANFCRGGAVKFIAISENAMTANRAILAFRHRINLDVLDISDLRKIPIPDLDDQLDNLDKVIREIMTITEYPFDANTACEMMRNHIKANCVDGHPPKLSQTDILIAGSGCAIENRLMASVARHHGMRVVNIFHGGSYGVQDKPTFNQGEKLMATDLAVFGKIQQFPGDVINFINGNYDKVAPVAPGSVITHPQKGDRLMYVPTSLRGENKRYGPFEDMADRQYVKLWSMMRDMFGSDLMIKLHPKNNDTADIAPPIITENFENCLDKADTFIFDYVSTAFTLAASTNKPIVYLDNGLQNFTKDGLKAIKSRCIYYDIRLKLPNSFDDIIKDAKSLMFNHDYVDKFVSAEGQASLDEELFQSLTASTF